MADDAGVGEKPLDVLFTEAGHPLDFEVGERGSEVLSLAEDGQPGKTGLESLEADLLEEATVVGHRTAPLPVVVGAVDLGLGTPPAARNTVLALDQMHGPTLAQRPFRLRLAKIGRLHP